jgi:hypothetical protein
MGLNIGGINNFFNNEIIENLNKIKDTNININNDVYFIVNEIINQRKYSNFTMLVSVLSLLVSVLSSVISIYALFK